MESYRARYVDMTQLLAIHADRYAGRLERVRAELRFADQLCGAYPDMAEAWRALVLEAGQVIDAGLRQGTADVERLTAEAEAILAPLCESAKQYTLLCIGHAHIDMNWQWSWPETVALTNDTFQTMLALMDEFPGFIFSQSQASVYAAIEKFNPAMFEQIRQRVREGRWEVIASQWVEGDTNMASGESISRHLLYTRAYFEEKFGLRPEDVRIDFEPDTFGHPATLPTILARGGVRYYYHCRGSRGPHLYWWVGSDGSRLLTLNDIQWYMHFDSGRRIAVGPNMAYPLMDFAAATGLRVMPVLYGVGDHGGGPTRRDLRKLLEMDTWPIYPHLEFSTLHRFYEIAESEAVDLPEITGERNFIFDGCYTSQARQKEANRHGENLLYASEAAATLGYVLAGVAYPQDNLVEAWRHLLFDQFHDILPGSGVRSTRHFALGHAQDTQAAAGMARSNALRALARRVDTETLRGQFADGGVLRAYKDEMEAGIALGAGVGNSAGTGGESAFSMTRTSDRAYLIFNPLAFERTEVIRVKLWDTQLDPAMLVVTSEETEPQAVQVLGNGTYAGHAYTEVVFPVTVPALGYRTVCVSDRGPEFRFPVPDDLGLWDGLGGAARTREPRDTTLENEFLRLRVDPASGAVVSLTDKRTGHEYVEPGAPLGVLEMCREANEGMSAWVIGQFMERTPILQGGRLVKVHAGPHVETLRWSCSVGETALMLEISLARGIPRVDFQLQVDWREVGDRQRGIPHLRVCFPMALETPIARFEVPFGSIQRDLFRGEEVPAQRWVDLSNATGPGMTLVNTSKYGFNVEGTSLNMTLLRTSTEPDPLPDLGDHVISYALIPHGPDWAEGEMTREGEAFNVPPVVTSCDFHEGDLPPAASLIEVTPQNVRLVALKKEEGVAPHDVTSVGGGAFVLRLVEVEGRDTEARVQFAPFLIVDQEQAFEVDILERSAETNTARLEGDVLRVPVPAYGITTVRVA